MRVICLHQLPRRRSGTATLQGLGSGELAVRDSAAPVQRGERGSPPPQVGHRLLPWRHKTGTPPETAAESHSPRRQSDKSFSMRRLTEYPLPPGNPGQRRVAHPPRLTRAAGGSTSRTPSSRGLGSARSKASVKQVEEGVRVMGGTKGWWVFGCRKDEGREGLAGPKGRYSHPPTGQAGAPAGHPTAYSPALSCLASRHKHLKESGANARDPIRRTEGHR